MKKANGFVIQVENFLPIRFEYYWDDAPQTCAAFETCLPTSMKMFQARVSGQEFWTDAAPMLDIPQENASVFTKPGEMVIGPKSATRTSTVCCCGIYYGEGKGLDACNIFACVVEEDRERLAQLGEAIWKNGQMEVRFTSN